MADWANDRRSSDRQPAAAKAVLEPARARLLAQLTEPRSAAMLAAAIGLPRQKVNYHLRALERHGLVERSKERRKGNVTERLLQAAAASYVIAGLGGWRRSPPTRPARRTACRPAGCWPWRRSSSAT